MNPPVPPDPERGLFETLLISGGRPVEQVAHFGRLAASARQLFGVELPAELPAEAVRASAGIELGRLRIDVMPDGPTGLRYTIEATPIDRDAFFPDWERGEALRSVLAEGWVGAHKWSDRRWLERMEDELGEEVPLLVGADGTVLEAGRANVLRRSTTAASSTPPADGRIVLLGTARAATLEIAAELGIPPPSGRSRSRTCAPPRRSSSPRRSAACARLASWTARNWAPRRAGRAARHRAAPALGRRRLTVSAPCAGGPVPPASRPPGRPASRRCCPRSP